MLPQSQADAAEPVLRARGSAAMLEEARYQYRQSCPARSCELGCRKKIATCAELKTVKNQHIKPGRPSKLLQSITYVWYHILD